jgi:hypothetical protein
VETYCAVCTLSEWVGRQAQHGSDSTAEPGVYHEPRGTAETKVDIKSPVRSRALETRHKLCQERVSLRLMTGSNQTWETFQPLAFRWRGLEISERVLKIPSQECLKTKQDGRLERPKSNLRLTSTTSYDQEKGPLQL